MGEVRTYYTVKFKLEIVQYAQECGTRAVGENLMQMRQTEDNGQVKKKN
jgi:hypothetical protein